jgi:hypothetical protein
MGIGEAIIDETSWKHALPVILIGLCLASCELAYPEVVVENRLGSSVLIKNISYNGCIWNRVLGPHESTSLERCLSGSDRVHFQMLMVGDDDLPLWFNYQTTQSHHAQYGGFLRVEITANDIEQDFSIPGPYGH